MILLLIKELDLKSINEQKLHFWGWKEKNELSAYYKNVDAVIVPSRWEAFGLTAVEAMMYSKPVIVSNRGALPELVKPKYNGYIFDMDDDNSLIAILESLNKDSLTELGKNSFLNIILNMMLD